MKINSVLLAGAITFGISSLDPVQAPSRALRPALGGDAALVRVERVRIKATFTSADRGKGETEAFAVLPDRFLETTRSVRRQSTAPEGIGFDGRQTVGFANIDVEDHETNRDIGFVGDQMLMSGEIAPSFIQERPGAADSLRAGRLVFARRLLPLLGALPTMTSSFSTPGAIVFQDRDMTTWTMTLDAGSRPATLTWERHDNAVGATRVTPIGQFIMTISDYRAVSQGLTWPHHFVTTINGKVYEDLKIRSYEVNGKAPKVLLK